MTTEELEAIIQGGTETQRIEFKGPCDWNKITFAKDILALSNVQDGGNIIIGVEDSTFARRGVTEEQKATFNEDIMKDQMAAYADPHVRFKVVFPTDSEGKIYAVIQVFEFEDVPVICKKDSSDTKNGCIYYRNRNRRMESAPVSNTTDLRDIIFRAVFKQRQYFSSRGVPIEVERDRLRDELGGL